MDKINELKKIIFDLKMDLVKAHVPKGHCPYTYYKPAIGRVANCRTMDCEKCRMEFLEDMEIDIRKEVSKL